MDLPSDNIFDLSVYWTWFLLFVRMSGVFSSMPGLGTNQIPDVFRKAIAMLLAFTVTLSGVRAPEVQNFPEGALMIIMEYIFGVLLGSIPSFIVAGAALAGQIGSTAIGLAGANLIDPSLGVGIADLAVIQSLIATVLFLLVDGHHVIIRAAALPVGDLAIGLFRPDSESLGLLISRFSAIFELAVTLCAPILVTILVTQFVMGLLTKFVPQVNVFLMSLPLTVGLGLFVATITFSEMTSYILREYAVMQDVVSQLGHHAPQGAPP